MSKMKLMFERTAYEKVQQLVVQCPMELMGWGKIRVEGSDILVVEDIVTFKQEVTSAHCELDKDKLMKFMFDQMKEPHKDHNTWRLWWHSHALMGTFWSGIDEENITRMGKTADWMVSVVFNHKMEYCARLDMWKPFSVGSIGMNIEITAPQETIDWAKAEIASKIKEKTYNYTKRSAGFVSPYEEDEWPKGKKGSPTNGKIRTIEISDRGDGDSIISDGGDLDSLDYYGMQDDYITGTGDVSWHIGTPEWVNRVDEIKVLLATGGNKMLNTEQRSFVTRFWEEFKGLFK